MQTSGWVALCASGYTPCFANRKWRRPDEGWTGPLRLVSRMRRLPEFCLKFTGFNFPNLTQLGAESNNIGPNLRARRTSHDNLIGGWDQPLRF